MHVKTQPATMLGQEKLVALPLLQIQRGRWGAKHSPHCLGFRFLVTAGAADITSILSIGFLIAEGSQFESYNDGICYRYTFPRACARLKPTLSFQMQRKMRQSDKISISAVALRINSISGQLFAIFMLWIQS